MQKKRLVRYVLVAVLALALGVLLGERSAHAEAVGLADVVLVAVG